MSLTQTTQHIWMLPFEGPDLKHPCEHFGIVQYTAGGKGVLWKKGQEQDSLPFHLCQYGLSAGKVTGLKGYNLVSRTDLKPSFCVKNS